MLQDNPLLAQLKQQLHQQTPRIEGIVKAHEKGFGFLEVDNKKSYFIPAHKMNKLINGDKVSGTIITNNDKESFDPETLVESALTSFLGQITFANKAMEIIPENQNRLSIRCKVSPDVKTPLKNGDWVMAKLVTHALDEGKSHFFAEVTNFVSESESPLLLWMKTLARYGLESTSPNDDQSFILENNQDDDRADLTDIEFFTIDSKETLDMDDALSISLDESGNYHLTVAIADPTSFIEPNSEIEKHAMKRCFTTYLPNYTVPMLPKTLANELCSLKESEKRPSVVCKILVESDGSINYQQCEFMTAWIKSKAKLSYSEVSDFIDNATLITTNLSDLQTPLVLLHEMAKKRIEWRKEHALLFKDNREYRFIFDEDRNPINIISDSRRIAHKMVEEAMLIANQVLSYHLKEKVGYGVFNVHSGIEKKFIDQAAKLLNDNELTEFTSEVITSFEGYKTLRRKVEQNELLDYKLRRLQAAADFSAEPKPHFSLGFESYATWTSPIRKYGDLYNHRLIKSYLCKNSHSESVDKLDQKEFDVMNDRRKTLRYAERDISERLYCQFLANKIGETFEAQILDINRGGARVRLTDIGAFAFMPLSLIHATANEISPVIDEGVIKIKEEVAYHLLDIIKVSINEVKAMTNNIIVKLA